MSKRSRALSSQSAIRSLPHLYHPSARGRWIRILAATLSLSICLLGWAGQVAAQTDTDGDGLSDFEEVSRVRTVPFGSQEVITTAADGASSVFAADLDGDGDPDALSASQFDSSASRFDNKIAWYENRLDEASADFGPQQVITTPARSPRFVLAEDLDGDGDPDVLSSSSLGFPRPCRTCPPPEAIAWHENRLDEASADFGPERLITTSPAGAR